MPADADVTLTIACDNPSCPGNTLDPASRVGWTFVTAEIYGTQPVQFVYCCDECAGNLASDLASYRAALPPPPGPPPVEPA